MNTPYLALTQGIHHVGLTVSRLEDSARFFLECLGWSEVRRDEDYPAIFVSDGKTMLTLWRVADPESFNLFDKNHNVGLHHIALQTDSETQLQRIFEKVSAYPGVTLEFAPEPLREGPAQHMMCFEPSGNRIEFIWPGY